MFGVENVSATIKSVTPRAEKIGKKLVPAMSIGFAMRVPASVLDTIDPSLRKTLYQKAKKDTKASTETQADLLPDNGDGLTAKKFPKIPGISWNDKLLGYDMDVGSGLTATDPLQEELVNLTDFWIEAMDGGTVLVEFKAAFHPDEINSGKFNYLLGQQVQLSLYPPEERQEVINA